MPLLPVIYRQTLWYIGSDIRSRGGLNRTRSAYIRLYTISLRDLPCDMPLLPVINRQTLWYIGSATGSRGRPNRTRSAYIRLYTMNRLGIYQQFRINSDFGARPKKKFKSKTQLAMPPKNTGKSSPSMNKKGKERARQDDALDAASQTQNRRADEGAR